MKILTVIGARPQFVKAAVVSREIAKHKGVKEIIVHTGQHFDGNMSDIFFKEMDIPVPDFNLNINGLRHGKMTAMMLSEIEEILVKEKPDVMLVYGDTNSTLAGALAASKLEVPIAHVEAGLRSFNMSMPEEINRILTDRISKYLFCPTQTAVTNLANEGYDNFDNHVLLSGDVMYEAALYYAQKSESKSAIQQFSKPFVLITIHRQENISEKEKLSELIDTLNELSTRINVVFPLHPGTAKKLKEHQLKLNFNTIHPVGYFEMIQLLKHCKYVITDSGGLQKEAFFFNKFCFTMREQTEWVELVETGVNFICGTNKQLFFEKLENIPAEFPKGLNLYGDGRAAEKIVNRLLKLN